MIYYIKFEKLLNEPHNTLSSENSSNPTPRMISLVFESDNVSYSEDTDGYSSDGYSSDGYSSDGYSSDGYSSDGYSSDGYSSESIRNTIIISGKLFDNDVDVGVKINKNGVYHIEDALFTSIDKITGYLNIFDIYEEPCVLMIKESSPITIRNSDKGDIPVVYDEANGTFIISSKSGEENV